MPIARRAFLGLGAMAGISALASGCAGQGDEPRSVRSTRKGPQSIDTGLRGAFYGSPPPGRLYYGANLPTTESLPAWEASLGSTLSVHRSFFTPGPGVTALMVEQCRDDLARDRLPHMSIKPPRTWQAIASGADDPWLSDLLGRLERQDGPVLLTIHHEPENDAGAPGMLPADFVGMQRHTIDLAKTLAPSVTIVPVLQHWTFDPIRTDIDPHVWLVPDAPVFGVDLYNPWSATNGKKWRTFSSLADEVVPWARGAPLVIGEYGCRENPQTPGLASDWLRDAAAYARETDIVAMSYFNSDVNSKDGSWELQGEMEQTFAELLASDWVARPH